MCPTEKNFKRKEFEKLENHRPQFLETNLLNSINFSKF